MASLHTHSFNGHLTSGSISELLQGNLSKISIQGQIIMAYQRKVKQLQSMFWVMGYLFSYGVSKGYIKIIKQMTVLSPGM